MKKEKKFSILLILLALHLSSCKQESVAKDTKVANQENVVADGVIPTQEIQTKLTPDIILQTLKKRNQDYTADKLTILNKPERIKKTASAQYPLAVVLSCIDSRVPVEDVFHSGIGDLFVARVAGAICNEDILGSLEYACKVSGAQVIVVLGHEHCGAIKSAIQKVELGNITSLLDKIAPAIAQVESFDGRKSYDNPTYLKAVNQANIEQTLANIRKNSSILQEMERKGEIKIVGAEYQMETGKVNFLD
ncbi:MULTISPECIES: carbonic anhydrase family protein [unclassified Myroides]|uniref:carbonic anhydrase family protein n=1 Tax=unclassified Myroides TaxID=2642485 RepID=UPI003D2F635F